MNIMEVARNLRNIFYYSTRLSMKTVEFIMVWITFVNPMLVIGSILYEKWTEIVSNPNPIDLLWILIMPAIAFSLVFTELTWDTIEVYKYYCAIFVMYEIIGLISIVVYVYPVILQLFCIEYSAMSMQEMLSDVTLPYFAGALNFITIFIIVFTHWIKNTIVHISLCRFEIFKRGSIIDSNEWNHTWILTSSVLLCLPILHTIYLAHNTRETAPQQAGFRSPVVGAISLYVFTVPLGLRDENHIISARICFWFGVMLTYLLFILQVESHIIGKIQTEAYSYSSELMLVWICCLSIGRQWFLDLEIQSERYEGENEDRSHARSNCSG